MVIFLFEYSRKSIAGTYQLPSQSDEDFKESTGKENCLCAVGRRRKNGDEGQYGNVVVLNQVCLEITGIFFDRSHGMWQMVARVVLDFFFQKIGGQGRIFFVLIVIASRYRRDLLQTGAQQPSHIVEHKAANGEEQQDVQTFSDCRHRSKEDEREGRTFVRNVRVILS